MEGGGEGERRLLPSWAADTAFFRTLSVSEVGFCENACAALLALAALAATPPTMTGRAELCTALELTIDELEATKTGVVTVGVIEADEDAENEVITDGPAAGKSAEDAELDPLVVALLNGKIGALGVDDGGMMLDEATLDEEAVLLDVICLTGGVLEAAVLLGVAVAVQYNCGTTL